MQNAKEQAPLKMTWVVLLSDDLDFQFFLSAPSLVS